MLATLEGLDHVVIATDDLDTAAQQWRDLGFVVSPRGVHSAHLGSGNHTIMLDDDYIELMGILTPTEHNAPTREFIESRGEGLERFAFRTSNAALGAEALRQRGFASRGPIDFSRPLDLPGGGQGEAAFSVFHWPVSETPAGMRIFACQHRTRDTVWIPELLEHPNTACGINYVEIIAQDPQDAAHHMAHLIDSTAQPLEDGSYRVDSGPGRAYFMYMTKSLFSSRHNIDDNAALPTEGAAALVLRARSLDAVARHVGPQALVQADHVTVPAQRATGVMLVFEQA